jgi:hypothetical protein
LQDLPAEEREDVLIRAEYVHSLRVDDLLEVYQAKCQDNSINYSTEQAIKFVEKVRKVCR